MWDWLAKMGVKTLFIELRSLRANCFIESFSGNLWDELLTADLSDTLSGDEGPV